MDITESEIYAYNKRKVSTLSASGAGVARVGGQGAETDFFAVVPNPNNHVTGTLAASGAGSDRPAGNANETDMLVIETNVVRRLTPRECERLQGFPDDYTLIDFRGKPAADGPRYRALGNSMAVPCMAWIGKRIQAYENQNQQNAA